MPLESGIRDKKSEIMVYHNLLMKKNFLKDCCQCKSIIGKQQIKFSEQSPYSEYFLRSFLGHFRKRHNPNTEDNQGTITKYLCAVSLTEVITPWEHSTVTPPEQNAEHAHCVKQAQKPPFRTVWVSSFQRYLQGSTTCLDESLQMPTRRKSQLSISPRNFLSVSTLEHKHWDTPYKAYINMHTKVTFVIKRSAQLCWCADPQKCSLARFFSLLCITK